MNVRRTVPVPSFGVNATATLTVTALPRWRLSAARTLRVSLTLIFSRAGERNVRRAVPAEVVRRPTFSRTAVARSTVAFAVRRPALLVRAKNDSTPLRVIVASFVELRVSPSVVRGVGVGVGVTVGVAVGVAVGSGSAGVRIRVGVRVRCRAGRDARQRIRRVLGRSGGGRAEA